MKKILALVACLSLVASLAIGGSIAYLTDRDSEANVFTIGDVSIKLSEIFDTGAQLTPGVNIDKKPVISNTGKNDAWVWATIAIPSNLDEIEDASSNVIHFNYSKESVAAGLWNWKNESDNWNVQKEVVLPDNNKYNVYTVLYETALKSGESTKEPVIFKVYMDPHVDIDQDGKVWHVENGIATDLEWNINDNGNPTIYVSAYAIQKEGFETVQAAYAAYNSQWTTKDGVNNGLEWGDPNEPVVSTQVVKSAEELAEALSDLNASIVLANDIELTDEWTPIGSKENPFTGVIDGNNHTISGLKINSDDYAALIETAQHATIKNLKVEGSVNGKNAAGIVGRAMGNTVIENCVNNASINGTAKAGGIACNVTGAEALIRNCVNSGNVIGGTSGLGGMIGYVNKDAYVDIIDCKNSGNIGNGSNYAGAAVGYAAGSQLNDASKGSIERFVNSGTITGKTIDSVRYLAAQDGTVLAGYCGIPEYWTVK